MKKTIFIIIVIGLISLIVYQVFLKKEKAEFSLVEVERSNLSQTVSETGQVWMGERINLGFKYAGRIERMYVLVGDRVEAGAALAKLDASQWFIELAEAQANLEISQAKLDKLLVGSTPEEIQIAQTAVDNAEVALRNARQKLEEDLNQAYENALSALDNAYLKGEGAFTVVDSIQKTYFGGNDQESIIVKEKKGSIEEALAEAKLYINAAKSEKSKENIDSALVELKRSLGDIYDWLGVIRNMTESFSYRDRISSTDKTSLDTERLNVNTSLTNIINSQQTITSAKLSGETSVNNAEGAFKKAQDELKLKSAQPTQEDVNLYQAQVRQARAKVELLENQIWEATLRSPVQGQVAEINKKAGETVQPALAEAVVSLIPASPYEVKVDIYEEDIIKMEVGNEVDISLIALPDQIFKGKVVSINPAEKLIEGVVYYEVTVNFEDSPKGIKPGMTADLVIKTASRENVLVIPEEAIGEKNGQKMVSVFENGQIKEREIEIGLWGTDDMVEVISGLAEGETIVIY